jgi:SAM-dependent methyltransferase
MERKPLRGSTWQEETDHLCLLGDVTRLPASFGGRFDLVFSTSAFEHICDLPAAMSVAARALKSGGHFFAVAMRLWLSSTGHHLPPVYHDGKRVDVGSDILLPWMHLYLTPEEMEERLAGRLPNDVVQQIVHHIYLSAHINRAMPEEYERAFMAADFSGRTIHRIYEAPTPPDIQERLEGLFGPGRFDQWGVRIIGEK